MILGAYFKPNGIVFNTVGYIESETAVDLTLDCPTSRLTKLLAFEVEHLMVV